MLRRRNKELLRERTKATNLKSPQGITKSQNKASVGFTGGTLIRSGEKEKLSVTEESRDYYCSKGDAV